MDTESDQRAGAETFVMCDACSAPVVLQQHPEHGYRLVCGCPRRAVQLGTETTAASLFEPVTGAWSQVDDPDWSAVWMDSASVTSDTEIDTGDTTYE